MNSKRTRIVFKKTTKPNRMDLELTYDMDNIDYQYNAPNFELIQKLPILLSDNTKQRKCVKKKYIEKEPDEEDCMYSEHCMYSEPVDNELEVDIDFENVIKDVMGSKTVYYDYNKHLIYNEKYIVIGSIDEDGVIAMNDDEAV